MLLSQGITNDHWSTVLFKASISEKKLCTLRDFNPGHPEVIQSLLQGRDFPSLAMHQNQNASHMFLNGCQNRLSFSDGTLQMSGSYCVKLRVCTCKWTTKKRH